MPAVAKARVAKKWIRGPADRLAIEQGCYFDPSIGKAACEFIETFCCQSKGRWAGQLLVLLPWQTDFLMRLFSWRSPDGKRRFKRAYLEVAKKNGKTTLLSALALLLLIADGEGAPEVYVLAVDRDQASILFDESARMVRSSPEFASRLELVDSRKRIIDPIGNGRIVAGSAEVSQKDGVSASCVIFDELHRSKTRDMWDVMEYAGASREQPLKISITTAGEDTAGIWHEQREYSEKVNAGVIPDITHLGVVYRALEEDDIDDPATWRKANPSLGHTISIDDFRRELAEAKEVPTKLANFRRLRLNVVTRGDQAFVGIEQWDACNDFRAALGHANLISEGPVVGGLDLSTVDDLTALAIVNGSIDSEVGVEMAFWLPEENIVDLEKRHQVPYRTWADMGLITLTPGNVIDYSFIRHHINALAQERDLVKLLIDPYNATKLGLELKEQDGLPIEYIRQGYLSLSGATKELLRLILSGQLRHGGHPILRWHASNCVAEQDAAGNIKLSKKKSQKKIDGMAALVNAIAAAVGNLAGQTVHESPLLLL
jgi:phage terminase large subunit-like protein